MKRTAMFFVSCLVFVCGCNSVKKPGDSNFKAAINQYLSTNGKTCIPVMQSFPIDIPVARLHDTFGTPAEMAALESAGLLRSSDTTAVVHRMLDALRGPTPPQPVKRYELTATGQKYFQQYPTVIGKSDGFCYGQKQVDSIVKWDEPVTQGSYSVTRVTYTYKLEQLADWATQPVIQSTFPVVKTTLDQAKMNQQIDLHLTNKGWEAGDF
jgi:hypothetical protein